MAQTSEGAKKILALKIGISVEEFNRLAASGQKWCYACGAWHPISDFAIDRTRYDGLTALCRVAKSGKSRSRYVPKIRTEPPGPPPSPPRDGDKKQARQRINVLVRTSKIPHPNSLPCVDCAHVFTEGERRHEYDHYKGYDSNHHYEVQAVCTLCHHRREMIRDGRIERCKSGHPYREGSFSVTKTGRRSCLECGRARDKGRRNAEYWRQYREKRKGKSERQN